MRAEGPKRPNRERPGLAGAAPEERAEGPKRPNRERPGLAGAVRVRFAPSPSGLLHLGNARTALFNWLFARGRGGIFVLRIEDTDRERSRPEFEAAILRDLRWLGLDWDEGPDVGGPAAPYRQSESARLYRDAVERLLLGGRAYRCFCSPAELEAERRRQEKNGQPPRYSGRCRNLAETEVARLRAAGRPSAIRFKMEPQELVVSDLVKGEIRFAGRDVDDFILERADGSASYHLAVVVDDQRMGVSHVIRGDDHLSNTPRQMALAEALGYRSPHFAHLPLIMGQDGAPLSKRHGSFSVDDFRAMQILPEALVNYLGLLGWSPPEGSPELMSLADMVDRFSLDRVSRSPARFDPKRLFWFSRQYLERLPLDRLLEEAHCGAEADEMSRRAVEALRGEVTSLADLSKMLGAVRSGPSVSSPPLERAGSEALMRLGGALKDDPLETESDAEGVVARVAENLARDERRALMAAARLALIGMAQGPPVAKLLWILGKACALERIQKATVTTAVNS